MGNLESVIWKPIEGYGEKGNIFSEKLKRSTLRNCVVFW
ncbi:nef attachable domain protein [Chlamydia psittaci C6/98]|nr:nef attachable domain protein [Chlamydia psittaci C6/98]